MTTTPIGNPLIEEMATIPFGLCQCGCGLPAPLAKWTDPRWGHCYEHTTYGRVTRVGKRRWIAQPTGAMVIAGPRTMTRAMQACRDVAMELLGGKTPASAN